MAFEIRPVTYDAIRPLIRNGDIALSRPSSIEGRLICDNTQTRYSHATLLGWAKPNTLMLGETRQHADARLIDARTEFTRWSGFYDVFRVREDFSLPVSRRYDYDGDRAWEFICHATGSRYGWNHIARAWLRRVAGVDVAPIPNSDDPQWPRDCSALDHAAIRHARGPILREFDADVVPGDLSDWRHFCYLGTVFADAAAIKAFEAARLGALPLRDGMLPAEAATDFDPLDLEATR